LCRVPHSTVNLDKPRLWKDDVSSSVDFYNEWFMAFAPEAYREQRTEQARIVEEALKQTDCLRNISPQLLRDHPSAVTLLRAATAPPIARDRLVGLAYVKKNLIESMEGKNDTPPRVPPRMGESELVESLERIGDVIERLADRDLLVWLDEDQDPQEADIRRAATVLADRLCGSAADPIIRNAQEKRQLASIQVWLEMRGYCYLPPSEVGASDNLEPGTFTFHLNVPVTHGRGTLNIPVDVAAMPLRADPDTLPLFIEAKSAGDFTNTNKRRKEEAKKSEQLRAEYGEDARLVLFLCGYFGTDYLGYMAAEGVDWIWEHRIDDLAKLGLASPDDEDSASREPSQSPDGEGPADGGPQSPTYPDPDWNFTGVVREGVADTDDLEAQRQQLQSRLDRGNSALERNRLGQFATPPELARAIVSEALEHLPGDVGLQFLEPSIGTGSFYSAILDRAVNREIVRAVGYEVDPIHATVANDLWAYHGLQVVTADFTEEAPPNPEERFNLLVANPPYVRHHHIPSDEKTRLKAVVRGRFGKELSGLTGLYVYFILLCHEWMDENGIAAWLIPTEFMDVRYGQVLRDYLTHKVTLHRVHRFAPEDVQFADALVSSAVLFFSATPPSSDHTVTLTFGGMLSEPQTTTRVPIGVLRKHQKWNPLFSKGTKSLGVSLTGRVGKEHPPTTLGDLFVVKRGLATGANQFFILKEEEALRLKLPRHFLRPILPSPRYISADEIYARSDGSPDLENRLVLVFCSLDEDRLYLEYPTLFNYLQRGIDQGIADRYLCSRRSPWYAQEKRAPAPILSTYMGRNSGNGNPLRFIRNRSDAIATNVYLNLYPKPFLLQAIESAPDTIEQIWQNLLSIPLEEMMHNGRMYGGGLLKAEPTELAAITLSRELPRDVQRFIVRQSELALSE